jgi:uncharacterized surface protein with fasciclin (FAS1) repeats
MLLYRLILISLLAVLLIIGTSAGQDESTGIVAAAEGLGGLNTFIDALERVGYVDVLDGGGIFGFLNDRYVVFAPNDQAFSHLGQGGLDSLLSNGGKLRTILSYHIIDRRKLEEDGINDLGRLRHPANIMTVQGRTVLIDNTSGLTINGARVVGSRVYNNGILYAIDEVLSPEEGQDLPYGEE